MTLPRRLLLLCLGLTLVAVATCALLYVVWPVERAQDRVRPAPTLFVPPP